MFGGLRKFSRHRLRHVISNSHAMNLIFGSKRAIHSLGLETCVVYIFHMKVISDWVILTSGICVTRAPAGLCALNIGD